ncbi:hypothetical protein Tco_0272738 [Tanacetum coccineum]
MTLKKTVTQRRKPQATNNYAAKYNYASAQTNNIEDEEEKEKEAAFNICSNLSVQKSLVQIAGEPESLSIIVGIVFLVVAIIFQYFNFTADSNVCLPLLNPESILDVWLVEYNAALASLKLVLLSIDAHSFNGVCWTYNCYDTKAPHSVYWNRSLGFRRIGNKKIPNDHEEILKLSKDSLEWKTKKELYLIFCKGFLLDNGQQRWYALPCDDNKATECTTNIWGRHLLPLAIGGDDGSDETIPNFKASDLHLNEWREVMQVCPKRTRAKWTTIYSQIQTRMENLHKTKHELEIDFNKPLGEQDPIIKLNDLAKNKRKHADDIHDYFRSIKRYKSSVQYEDHPAGTVLNEPCLGMILFNSHQRQDFVNIKDFEDFNNEMLYIV